MQSLLSGVHGDVPRRAPISTLPQWYVLRSVSTHYLLVDISWLPRFRGPSRLGLLSRLTPTRVLILLIRLMGPPAHLQLAIEW